jgi:hypothetical protein
VAYLLGFFLCVIAVFAAAVETLIGMSNVSTSERVGTQSPTAVVERNVTTTHRKPRLYMVVPDTKESSVKNAEASSTATTDENAEAKKSKAHKHNAFARHDNYRRPGYWSAPGYAENGQKGFFNW